MIFIQKLHTHTKKKKKKKSGQINKKIPLEASILFINRVSSPAALTRKPSSVVLNLCLISSADSRIDRWWSFHVWNREQIFIALFWNQLSHQNY